MAKCIVIADDLTGANATGVLFSKMNYKSFTFMNDGKTDLDILESCDCALFPTDSRALPNKTAYNKVFEICSLLKNENAAIYSKRIDSTLRGNIGSETDAMLDALGEDYIAIVAPCFPSSRRRVIGSYMLVEETLLHKTPIATDPLNPMSISKVDEIIKQQSKYKVSALLYQDLMHGEHHLAECITNETENGARIIVLDCLTQDDLELITDAVILSDKKIICVDPGPFTATLARKTIKQISPLELTRSITNKILVIVGSVNPKTQEQMEELLLSKQIFNVLIHTREFLESPERREAEIERVSNVILENSLSYAICCITGDGIYPKNRIDFNYYLDKCNIPPIEICRNINSAFAEIAHRICSHNDCFKGLYTSGGDITVAVCERFGSLALDLQEEVLPLAAYSRFIKGDFDGMHLITKGGSQGNKNSMKECVTFLKEKINTQTSSRKENYE